MQDKLTLQQRVTDLDLQAKCSNDARLWFNRSWNREDTNLLDYQNHYNKSLNKCFALVQFNWSSGKTGNILDKSISVHDVYENVERGHGGVTAILRNSEYKPTPNCQLDGEEKTFKEFQECFNLLWSSFMEK